MAEDEKKKSILDHILSGIGFMLPCIVAGGLLMGLGYMFDDGAINPSNYGHNTVVADFFTTTGMAIFGMMLPVLAAGIGYSIGGIPAIAAGLAGGYLCAHGTSGFLGALVEGFIAGYIILLLIRLLKKVPKSLDGIRTLLLYPVISVAVIGACSAAIVEPLVGELNSAMNAGLTSMSGSTIVLLGFVVAAMEAFDMGGPVNKTAYMFAVATMANGQYNVIAAVLAGAIVPPYITALSTTIFRRKFTAKQRQTGLTNYIIGLTGITECVIPFWAADPVRFLLASVLGAGIAGAISMNFGCSVMAPFGGVFIFPLNSNLPGYLIAIFSGIAAGTLIYGLIGKNFNKGKTSDDPRVTPKTPKKKSRPNLKPQPPVSRRTRTQISGRVRSQLTTRISP